MKPDSLAFRLVAGAAVWSVVALAVGGLTLSLLFRQYVERNFDARLLVLLESLVAAAEVDDTGRLTFSRGLGETRFDQPYSGWYWQISAGSGSAMRSRSLWDQTLAVTGEPDGDGVRKIDVPGPDAQPLRLVARDIALPGADQAYLFAVAGNARETAADIQAFNQTLTLALGLLGVGLIVAMIIQVRYGLLPLRQIGATLSDIRAGRAGRLEGRFPAEIRPLANELNGLLAHNADVVERARGHVADLAHGLKTPLTVLANEAARGDGALADVVGRQTVGMRRQIDHHLARARAAAMRNVLGARTEAAPVVADITRTLSRIHADRGIDISVTCPDGLAIRGERQDLEEMIGNLVDNACKWARSRVVIDAAPRGDDLTFTIDDDGPGLPPDQHERVLERGTRLDETVPGSGFGLAIVRDIAGMHGGGLTLADSDLGGLRATLRLPRAVEN